MKVGLNLGTILWGFGNLFLFHLGFGLSFFTGFLFLQLLGKDCYDIDIALDNMLGSEFVDKVREYLLTIGEEAQGVAVIPWYDHLYLHSIC